MDTAREFHGKCCIDRTMPLQPGLPSEGRAHDIHPVVGLAARAMATMARMQMRFIDNAQAFGAESFG